MYTNEFSSIDDAANLFKRYLNEVYGGSFLIVLDYYTKLEEYEDSFSRLIIKDPVKAYDIMLKIFKVELTIRILFEILISKLFEDILYAEKKTEELMNSFKRKDGEKAKEIILETLRVKRVM
ncbi:MAG: hypothetical protein H5T50_10330 [Nitrososphaeria archaeon]|nr:hypothetical protein [Nitrososphaeria archaeon]